MDPISVITSVLGVIEVTHTVTTRCIKYIKSARNVYEEALRLLKEVGCLKIVLNAIEQVLQRGRELQETGYGSSSGAEAGGSAVTTSLPQLTPTTDTEDEHEDPYLLPTLRKIYQLKELFDECKNKMEKLGN